MKYRTQSGNKIVTIPAYNFSIDIQVGTLFPGQYINITEAIPPDEIPGHNLEHKKYIITTIMVSFVDKHSFCMFYT